MAAENLTPCFIEAGGGTKRYEHGPRCLPQRCNYTAMALLPRSVPHRCQPCDLRTILLLFSWIRDCTLKTIFFFDMHAETSPCWPSYIPVRTEPSQGSFETLLDKNKELLVLGLILLLLGQRNCGELIKDQEMAQKALVDLCRTFGRIYKRVVEKLLGNGKDRNADLMGEKDLEKFLSALDALKDLVENLSVVGGDIDALVSLEVVVIEFSGWR